MSEGYVDPIAQKLMDAQSRFDHRSAETKFNQRGIHTRKVWKGNHHRCKHDTGVCDADNAWLVSFPRLEQGKYPFVRITIDMNMERRAQGGQVVEYPPHLDLDDEPLYKAKGFKAERDVENADGIRPSSRVESALVTAHIKGVEETMKYEKAPYTEIQKAKAEAQAKFDAALKPAKSKAKDA